MSVIDEMKKYKNILNEARIVGDPDIAYTMGAKTKKCSYITRPPQNRVLSMN